MNTDGIIIMADLQKEAETFVKSIKGKINPINGLTYYITSRVNEKNLTDWNHKSPQFRIETENIIKSAYVEFKQMSLSEQTYWENEFRQREFEETGLL